MEGHAEAHSMGWRDPYLRAWNQDEPNKVTKVQSLIAEVPHVIDRILRKHKGKNYLSTQIKLLFYFIFTLT